MYNLSPCDFDQSDFGWRLLDAQGKYLEAATAIEAYLSSHVSVINAQSQVSVQTIYFHAGQEYAMAGPEYYQRAISNFRKSYKSKVDWDTYVDGTIAFLSKDKDKLQKAADKLSRLANTDSVLEANAQLLSDYIQALAENRNYAAVYDKATKYIIC